MLVTVPGSAITDPAWLDAQLTAAGVRYRYHRRAGLGVLWWYSASSVLLGPPVESLLTTGAAASPDLPHLTLYLHPDGRILDARSDAVIGADVAILGPRLAATLSTSIDAVTRASGASRRALWAIATDSLANRVLWAGGPPTVAEDLAAAIGPALPPPRYVTISGHLVVRRASCCLIYEAPGQEKCVSCPRQTPDERLRRLEAAFVR